MKKKLFIVVLLTVATSIVAATSYGYRIISEETYSTPGFDFHVEPGSVEIVKNENKVEDHEKE